MEQRTCPACKNALPLDAFYADGRNTCKACRRKSVYARRDAIKASGCCIECRVPVEGGGSLCLGCKQKHLDRYHANQVQYSARSRKRRRGLKQAALEAYGGAFCACCEDSHLEFLTIDHIAQNGAEHRREMVKERGWNVDSRSMSGSHFYLWLKQNNYPEGFRVLCFNCNFAFGHFGYCPHDGIVREKEAS